MDRRQSLEAPPQRDEVPRVGASARDAGRQALEVEDAGERIGQRAGRRRRLEQLRHGVLPGEDRTRLGERGEHPVTEQSLAHRRPRPVDDRDDRRAATVAAQRLDELQALARHAVEHHVRAATVDLESPDVGERRELGLTQVGDQRAGRTHGGRHLGDAEAVERLRPEEPGQRLDRRVLSEVVDRASGQRAVAATQLLDPVFAVLRDEHFGRIDAFDLVEESPRRALEDLELARRKLDPREAGLAVAGDVDRGKVVRAGAAEEVVLGQRARGDDPDDTTLDQPLGLLGVLDLLADRDLLAELDEAAQVAVDRPDRDTGHRDRIVALVACGERDLEQLGGALRVVEEQLVEVAHPEEQQRVRVPGLLGDVLGHRRGHAVDLGQREAPPARCRSRSASATRMSTARSASS